MRLRWLWIAVFALALLGCLARRPPEPVAMLVSIPAPAQVAAPAQAPADPGYGYLDLRVHWPTDDLPGFQAAAIPKTTRSLVVTVYKSSSFWAGPEVASRTPGSGTYSFKRMRVREGDNLSVEVKAFRDEVPILEGASASVVIASTTKAGVTVRSATSTSADVTLRPCCIPSIDSFSTSIAPVGDTIILYGKNLNPVENLQPRVYFGTVEAAEVTSLSATQLRVKVPVNAPTGAVVVKSDGLSSAPDEDNFWVPTAVTMDAASESWDPSGGDNRIVVVGASLSLIPRPTFAAATPGPNWPSKEVQYTVGNSSAGTASEASQTFTAGSSVATTSLSVKIGSLEGSNALTVSVEDIVSLKIEPPGAALGPYGAYAIQLVGWNPGAAPTPTPYPLPSGKTVTRLTAVSKLSGGATGSLPVDFTSGDAAKVSVSGGYATQVGDEGFVTLTARSAYLQARTASASIVVTAAAGVTTLAGSAGSAGSSNGTSSAARFYGPTGVAVDATGNVYVADQANHTIRKATPEGVVTTLAGSAGSSGSSNGTGSAARFYYPNGVAVSATGDVYVADQGSHTIRKVTPAGVATTLAGLAGSSGSSNGTGSAARFYDPTGVAVDATGNVYVADLGNNTIRKATPEGVVTTLAGLAGSSGSSNGTGTAARFYYPFGVAVDAAGNVYVADLGNNTIRKVTPGGVVTTLAGLAGSEGSSNGTGSAARFRFPSGIAVDSTGNVYVADKSNHTIRKVTPGGVVTTIAGLAGSLGSSNGTGSAARFYEPDGVAVDEAGRLYVGDTSNHVIRRIRQGTGELTQIGPSSGGLSLEIE